MKNKTITQFCLIFFLSCTSMLVSQTLYQVHSHNDYKQAFPFWKAYIHNAASIEADVILKNEKLNVAHQEDEIQKENTLQELYLEPLSKLARAHKLREIQLLIDLKTEAIPTLAKLLKVLKNYPELTDNNKLTFVISGNRPAIESYKDYPDFIKFDHQNFNDLNQIDLNKIALLSTNFKDHSVWNGLGRLTAKDLKNIKNLIQQAKKVDKPIRFWGAPDTKTAWSRFAGLGVDFINTDQPDLAIAYLNDLDKNTYIPNVEVDVYTPEFSAEILEKPTNIILMIGDGNGLNQISSGMIANKGELSLTQLKDIGLIKTSSYDDLVTDSAAGGTAMATGTKTNNRAIGTGPDGEILKGLPEILSKKGYINGIITNDNITGATPSAFYAHVEERDNRHQILEDLKESKIDFFVSSGEENHSKLKKEFIKKDLSDFNDFEVKVALYLSDKRKKTDLGEKSQFTAHVKKVLQNLESREQPYFLVIEGAKIDSYGHTNEVSGIINEVLDFDKAVAEVLKVADKNKNTLVIITADHETSGFGIMQGSRTSGKLEGDFLTRDHTATMVPIFAYGPKSEIFTGVFENTAIFTKILEALELAE